MLHKNDFASVSSNDVLGIAEEKCNDGTGKHENDEGDIRAVRYVDVAFGMDGLAERDLKS
jgi:hypothetical protein